MRQPQPRLLKIASGFTLVALGMIIFAIVNARPLAVMAAMSIGQGLGTIGFILFAIVILRDLKPILKNKKGSGIPSERPSAASESKSDADPPREP